MKFEFEKPGKPSQQPYKYIIYAIIALLISLIHVVFLHFIEIEGVTPDLLLIFCVWLTLTEGPFIGLFAGFGCGLLFDLISNDVIGSNALVKTIVCFISSFFYRENKTELIMKSFRFVSIVLLSSFIHNMIYFFFYIKPSEITFFPFMAKYVLAFTLYTGVVAIFVLLINLARRKIRV